MTKEQIISGLQSMGIVCPTGDWSALTIEQLNAHKRHVAIQIMKKFEESGRCPKPLDKDGSILTWEELSDLDLLRAMLVMQAIMNGATKEDLDALARKWEDAN